jgi:FAD/FMN-containing dehydrogenase
LREENMIDDRALEDLRKYLHGVVITPGDPTFEEARKLYNGMINRRPLVIARCVDVADVMAAVDFGRDNNLPIAVRGGGHNGPGFGSVDDGLVIDLSIMKGVRVDPVKRTARVNAGCVTGDLDHATSAFGQAVPVGVVASTGVSGLTLSGGHGYLTRQYGLTVDNLLEADVVLADGKFVTASETENADLFWALRGGGGNFGIVTSFLFRTSPADIVYGGPMIFDITDATTVMRWYREFQRSAPNEFYIFLALQSVPPLNTFPRELWGKKMCALNVCHNGPVADGEKAVKAIRAALPPPIIDAVQPMPLRILQSMFDPLLPKGLFWYWKGDFVDDLPDTAIEIHLAHAKAAPHPMCIMHLYPIDGVVHRERRDATAWGHRDTTWSMVIAGVSPDPGMVPALKQWASAYWEAIHPFNLPGAYANFMMDDESDARVKASYGENYQRLTEVKTKYDPGNLFRVNQNIRPAS